MPDLGRKQVKVASPLDAASQGIASLPSLCGRDNATVTIWTQPKVQPHAGSGCILCTKKSLHRSTFVFTGVPTPSSFQNTCLPPVGLGHRFQGSSPKIDNVSSNWSTS